MAKTPLLDSEFNNILNRSSANSNFEIVKILDISTPSLPP